MVAQFILALSILVSLHELGHYAAARMFGIKVEKFFVFFDAWGYKLFSLKSGDTEYGVGWLPLGGYVKITGMIDESMDREAMKEPPKDYEFRSKPAWQRFIVMIAGVFVNLVLGVLIFSMMAFQYGDRYLPAENMEHGIVAEELGQKLGLETGDQILKINDKPIERFEDLQSPDVIFGGDTRLVVERDGEEKTISLGEDFLREFTEREGRGFVQPRFPFSVGEVVPGSPADEAGLQPNDRIVKVEDDTIRFFDEIRDALQARKGEEVSLTVERNSELLDRNAQVNEEGQLGFRPLNELEFERETYGFFASFNRGFHQAFESLYVTIQGLGTVITGQVQAQDALQGPIGIATLYGGEWNWQQFWMLTGLISMILAFMNILPIPALDGGHATFLIIEMIRGKPVSQKVMEAAQVMGMVILLSLMVFVFYIDIARLF